jgi:hypothetical protein
MQEQKSSCANCGAELMADAKFCRKCGQPANTLGRGSVTEVTTRRLGTPGQAAFMPGQGMAGQQSLEQQGSGQANLASSAETRSLAPASTLKRWLPGLLLLTVLVLVPLIYIVSEFWHPKIIKIVRPSVEAPAVPQPPQPPQPPAPAQPAAKANAIDQSYYYPDASTTMVISKAGEGDVVQLQTGDSVEKVTDWYTNKLKPTQVIRQPENVVLKSDKLSVFIRSSGDGTSIMLKQGED